MIATSFYEMLATLFATLGAAGLLLGTYVWFRLNWERRQQSRTAAEVHPLAFLEAGFEFCADGRPRARLIWAGRPADPNHFFTPYDVSILAGCEAEVETLLYRSRDRHPDNARISYRSLDPAISEFSDSQVLIGYLGGARIELKIYFDEKATNPA